MLKGSLELLDVLEGSLEGSLVSEIEAEEDTSLDVVDGSSLVGD